MIGEIMQARHFRVASNFRSTVSDECWSSNDPQDREDCILTSYIFSCMSEDLRNKISGIVGYRMTSREDLFDKKMHDLTRMQRFRDEVQLIRMFYCLMKEHERMIMLKTIDINEVPSQIYRMLEVVLKSFPDE